MHLIQRLLTLEDDYSDAEQHLIFKTKALIFIGFLTGFIVLFFSFYRLYHHEYPLGSADLVFAIALMVMTYFMRLKKSYYDLFSTIFIILAFILISINFNISQDNHTRILWFSTFLVFTFYLKNRVVGFWVLFFFIGLVFVSSYLGNTHFDTVENITIIANLTLISIVMFWNDKFREADRQRLMHYNEKLEADVKARTSELNKINAELTEKVNREVSIRMEQEQLLFEKNRLADMGKMLDNIAHQWRQPLMNINASILNIHREKELQTLSDTKLDTYLDGIESTTSYMSSTIEDFRNFFKQDDMKEKSGFDTILSNVLNLLKSATKEIDILSHGTIPKEALFFKGELTQVLMSILVNAIEALHTSVSDAKIIQIHADEEDAFYRIRISDNGRGIAEENISKIFHPYFTTKKSTGGSGLGLYTAKMIVENHFDGKLEVSNTQNGALFTILIRKPKETDTSDVEQ